MANLARIFHPRQLTGALSITRNITSNVYIRVPPLSIAATQTNFINNPWIWQQHEKIRAPIVHKTEFDLPNGLKWVPPLEEPTQNLEIEMPPLNNMESPLEAARLIVIRRKKMKKHKLKKLRKRMKYEWAKRRQRRELKKEKDFQAVLIMQCKEAEAFSAEKYVEERLSRLNEVLKEPTPEDKTGYRKKRRQL